MTTSSAFSLLLDSSQKAGVFYREHFYGELFERGLVPRDLKEVLRLRLSGRHRCLT